MVRNSNGRSQIIKWKSLRTREPFRHQFTHDIFAHLPQIYLEHQALADDVQRTANEINKCNTLYICRRRFIYISFACCSFPLRMPPLFITPIHVDVIKDGARRKLAPPTERWEQKVKRFSFISARRFTTFGFVRVSNFSRWQLATFDAFIHLSRGEKTSAKSGHREKEKQRKINHLTSAAVALPEENGRQKMSENTNGMSSIHGGIWPLCL